MGGNCRLPMSEWRLGGGPLGERSLPRAVYSEAGGGAGFGGEPFVEGGLAFHDQHAGGHGGMGVAAELGAVDLVAALFDRA